MPVKEAHTALVMYATVEKVRHALFGENSKAKHLSAVKYGASNINGKSEVEVTRVERIAYSRFTRMVWSAPTGTLHSITDAWNTADRFLLSYYILQLLFSSTT